MTEQGVLFEGAEPPKKLNVGALFCSRYKIYHYQTYRITGRDKAAIKNLNEQWDASEEAVLKAKMDLYVQDYEDRFVQTNGWPLWLFEQRQNKYQVSVAPPSEAAVAPETTNERQEEAADEFFSRVDKKRGARPRRSKPSTA